MPIKRGKNIILQTDNLMFSTYRVWLPSHIQNVVYTEFHKKMKKKLPPPHTFIYGFGSLYYAITGICEGFTLSDFELLCLTLSLSSTSFSLKPIFSSSLSSHWYLTRLLACPYNFFPLHKTASI